MCWTCFIAIINDIITSFIFYFLSLMYRNIWFFIVVLNYNLVTPNYKILKIYIILEFPCIQSCHLLKIACFFFFFFLSFFIVQAFNIFLCSHHWLVFLFVSFLFTNGKVLILTTNYDLCKFLDILIQMKKVSF